MNTRHHWYEKGYVLIKDCRTYLPILIIIIIIGSMSQLFKSRYFVNINIFVEKFKSGFMKDLQYQGLFGQIIQNTS